jgi:uncharacterized protein with HEPN domain
MKRTEDLYLGDMLQYAREAQSLTARHDAESFEKDRMLQLAITYLVQIIGEAAANVSDERRAALPQLPWDQMRGMRHRIVHDYTRVSFRVVWDVVEHDLPQLIAALETLTPTEPPSV